MKRAPYFAALTCAAASAALLLPILLQRSLHGKNHSSRRVLYYTDPMHPSYKSEKPGIAPDCGMKLEPVYAEESADAAPKASAPSEPPIATLSADQRRRLGLTTATVERITATHTVRLFGRVMPDETRVYRLIAGMDGVVRRLSTVTTGSQVSAGQLLATFSAPELRAPIQGYIVSLDVVDRQKSGGATATAQMQAAEEASQQALDRLLNLGLSRIQLDEILRTRAVPTDLHIYAPASGIVLARNVSNGQRFDKGTEWFRIADLRRVWITADVFESDAAFIRPGNMAHVFLPGGAERTEAKVSAVLPEFDAASRTLKVRFELDNAGYVFRPDMPVDVQAPLTLPPALVIPEDALLDSGLRKTAFVDLGDGRFEQREVQTGWRFDGRVQILDGLQEGERIATSANFLLDSETRMQTAIRKPDADGGMRQ